MAPNPAKLYQELFEWVHAPMVGGAGDASRTGR